ncbi:MAG TPA: POTRA domain-containing protein [Thermoanaerobaculia bacterium]|jgi:outer membrane protein assembly factor BamA|nr:POTRA domain-containing protein [Thermoanaerobaculia bacterium]
MVVSPGCGRPPVFVRVVLAGACALALFAVPARAQPSASLLSWLRAGIPAETPVLAAGPDSPPTIPPGSVIGEVHVVNRDIFDTSRPEENHRLFRLANRLHRTTRGKVIERQLLFKPGDVFSPELVAESARLLRTNDYLYDVDVKPTLRQDGKVDVEVVTRDVWTLSGGVSFGRAGGVNTTSFSAEDTNLLGTGKDLAVARIGTVDRISNLVRYTDPSLAGSRLQLLASHAENSDGGRERLELERPFYSLDSRWAAGMRLFRDDRLEQLYTGGKVATGFRHVNESAEIYGGFSPGLVGGTTHRWELGYTWSRDDFTNSPLFSVQDPGFLFFKAKTGIPANQLFAPPADRALSYPWVRFESVENRFVVEKDLDRIQRSEDLNLGRQWNLLVGYSSPAFGGLGNRWVFQSAASNGWRPTPRQLVLAQVGTSGQWYRSDAENLVAGGRVRWYARDFGDNVFYSSLGADLAHRLDGEDQLLLGGDSGLRGYPLRYQAGDRRVLFTVEQRFFSDREVFHLIHPGAAIFFDAGRAWFVDAPLNPLERFFQTSQNAYGKVLRDAGLGLRLGSSRSARGAVVHLDIAFPLDRRGAGINAVQWLVSTHDTF